MRLPSLMNLLSDLFFTGGIGAFLPNYSCFPVAGAADPASSDLPSPSCLLDQVERFGACQRPVCFEHFRQMCWHGIGQQSAGVDVFQ